MDLNPVELSQIQSQFEALNKIALVTGGICGHYDRSQLRSLLILRFFEQSISQSVNMLFRFSNSDSRPGSQLELYKWPIRSIRATCPSSLLKHPRELDGTHTTSLFLSSPGVGELIRQ